MTAVERQHRQQVEQRDREADQADDAEEVLHRLLEGLRGRADDADRARDVARVVAGDEAGQRAGRVGGHVPDHAHRPPRGLGERVPRSRNAADRETDAIGALVEACAQRADRDAVAVARNDDREGPPVRCVDRLRDRVRLHRMPGDADDVVTRLKACRCGGMAR